MSNSNSNTTPELVINPAAFVYGTPYADRLVAAFDAIKPAAVGEPVKYILRTSVAKSGKVTAYVNLHTRLQAGEDVTTVAELRGATPDEARAWLQREYHIIAQHPAMRLRDARTRGRAAASTPAPWLEATTAEATATAEQQAKPTAEQQAKPSGRK